MSDLLLKMNNENTGVSFLEYKKFFGKSYFSLYSDYDRTHRREN